MEERLLLARLSMNPEVKGGKPVIKGTRPLLQSQRRFSPFPAV